MGARFEQPPGPGQVKLSQGPSGRAAHQRLDVVERSAKRRQSGRIAPIAKHDRGIAQQSAPLRAPERRMPKAAAEVLVVQREQLH